MARLTIIANHDGDITDTHGAVSEILGWDPEELIGLPVSTIIPFKYRERHASGWERWTETGVKKAMGTWLEVSARRKDGNTIPVTFCVTERGGSLEAFIETPADPTLPPID